MAVVKVEIRPKAPAAGPGSVHGLGQFPVPLHGNVAEPVNAEVIEDMDEYVEHAMCSCNASDDNPY